MQKKHQSIIFENIARYTCLIQKKAVTLHRKITKLTFSPMNNQHRKGGALHNISIIAKDLGF